MNTLEILRKLYLSVMSDPDTLKNVDIDDLQNALYLDIECKRQLYTEEQLAGTEIFFQTLLKEIYNSMNSGNIQIMREKFHTLISHFSVIPDTALSSDFIERANLDHALLDHIRNNTTYVIGDSHVSAFSGNEGLKFVPIGHDINTCCRLNDMPFTAFHLGPCLAYNTNKYNTTNRFREKLDYLLESVIEPGSKIIFIMGWIDLSAHVFKEAAKQNKDHRDVIDVIISNYAQMMTEIKDRGFKVICSGPIAALAETAMQDKDTYGANGTEVQRNRATGYFTDKLRDYCNIRDIPFMTLFNELVTQDWTTKLEYICDDGCHLGNKAFPLICQKYSEII